MTIACDASKNDAEVLRILKDGFWLRVREEELFLSFAEFPWFRAAPVAFVFNVQLRYGFHLRWPELDVDLEVESVRHPENYPLRDKATMTPEAAEQMLRDLERRFGIPLEIGDG